MRSSNAYGVQSYLETVAKL